MKTSDDKTPNPTPALLPPARLAEIRERVAAGKFEHTMSDRAALLAHLAHLDALAPRAAPCDREAGGCLVREVWIAWAKEQPSPKPSWLVPWEGLSEPDKEVDRRIFEACYAAGRASLDALAPVDGEALAAEVRRIRGEFTWGEALREEEEAEDRTIGTALHAIGYAAGRSEGEAERLSLHRQIADIHRIADEEQGLRVEAEGTIARLTAELAAEREAHRVASAALHDRTAELAGARATGERAEQAMRLRDASLSRIEADRARKEADARHDGAREEREACAIALTTLRNGSDPRATERIIAFDEAVDAIRARGEGGGR